MSDLGRRALRLWRRLGTRAMIRIIARRARRTLTVPWLRLRPRRIGDRALDRALGGDVAAALERATRLQPPLRRLDRELERTAADPGLISLADQVREHRFDLLGVEVAYGEQIEWSADPLTGESWPMGHRSSIPRKLGPDSDIRRVWELGRLQHLPLLAVAWRQSGEQAYLDELGAQIRSFAESQPVEFGPQWVCPMDVAIRAANLIAALCLARDSGAEWLREGCALAVLHGRFVRANLEWGKARGNHYLADVAGLAAVAALLAGSDEGRRLAEWAAAELEAELDRQVHADGGNFEASLYYHRLVCEMFYWSLATVEEIVPGRLGPGWLERLRAMAAVTAACSADLRDVPQIGDSDDARYLPLAEYGADPADHSHLFDLLGVPPPQPRSVSFADVGWHVLRRGEVHLVARCGRTGRDGLGGHCHNDQMGFVLHVAGHRLIADPGTYAYTGDPEARDLFRSTGFHATLQLDGEEQNPLDDLSLAANPLFVLPDRSAAEVLCFESGPEPEIEGVVRWPHLDPPAEHRRRIRLGSAGVSIEDVVSSEEAHRLSWCFPLQPGSEVTIGDGLADCLVGSGRIALRIAAPGCGATVREGAVSPRYGIKEPAPFVVFSRASVPGEDAQSIELSF